MTYLTNHTFQKLCRKINLKEQIEMADFVAHIYNDSSLFYFFNSFELKYLFNFKTLLENNKETQVNYFEYVPERKDTKQFVFEKKGTLKYHLYNDCDFLKKDFVNYNIPPEIKELGSDAIEEYRTWFIAKGFATKYEGLNYPVSKIIFHYNLKYPKKYAITPLAEDYPLIEEKTNTSQIEEAHSFDYNEFLNSIEDIKKQRSNAFQCKVTRTLSKFDYLLSRSDDDIKAKVSELYSPVFITNYGLDTIKTLFKNSKQLKHELMKNLIAYFKWTYLNNGKNIDVTTLEDFGLGCCSKCKERELQGAL